MSRRNAAMSPAMISVVFLRESFGVALTRESPRLSTLQKVQAVDKTQAPNRKCNVLFHVIGDAFHLSLQLRHHLHQMMSVVAPQVVKEYWYLVGFWLQSQFKIA